MSLGEMPEDFLTVIKPHPRPGLFVRLRDSEAISTITRARRKRIETRDMIALVIGLTVIGFILGASIP